MPFSLRPILLFCLGFWLVVLAGKAAVPEAVTFSIHPAPAWVRPIIPPAVPTVVPQGDGIDYLLVDQQENVEPPAAYYHEVRSIFSQNGVQNGSAITVSFDPTYQKLIFHSLRVIRQNTPTDRLDRSRIKLFQRESEMDYFLYDGTYTAQCQLEDIRVGDVIEYAYTIEGANPVMQGHYTDSYSTNWGSPVHRAVTRLVYPTKRKMFFKGRNKIIHPTVTTTAGKTEWLWDESDIPAQHVDGSTPAGYSPFGAMQVTDFESWNAVVEWALPLYEVKLPLSPDLQAEIEKLKAVPDKDERVLAALRFAQDEIRYLGIEIGPGSHQPTHPQEVLRRRFGDCKDKTQLLATLLRETGIEVAPALVSTGLRKEIATRLPSPAVFNHVILRVVTPSGVHWLDSTRSQQRGPLPQIAIGDYGYALVLRLGETELTAYSPPLASLPSTKMVEKYRIAPPGEDALLDVMTEYRGASAERNRGYQHENDPVEIQKKYLQYYARRFPSMQVVTPYTFEEMPHEEGCVITEHYRIPKIWTMKDDHSKYTLALYPTDIENAMGETTIPQRDDPLALTYPQNITQHIQVEMFEDWPLTGKDRDVKNAYFHFQHHSKGVGKHLDIIYSFATLADRVAAVELATYNTELGKLKDTLGYIFTYSTPAQLAEDKLKNPAPDVGKFNWPVALVLGVVLFCFSLGCIVLYFATKRTGPPPLPTQHSVQYSSIEPTGLGGWLILVGFGAIARPFVLTYGVVKLCPAIFKLATWHALTIPGSTAYHPLWSVALLFELFYNSIGLIFCLFILVLFFRKKALTRPCFIAIFIYGVLGSVTDYLICTNLPAVHDILPETIKALWQNALAAAIWIPYFLVSRRVKNTFRR